MYVVGYQVMIPREGDKCPKTISLTPGLTGNSGTKLIRTQGQGQAAPRTLVITRPTKGRPPKVSR